jgi:hypothetical protein
MFQVVTIKNGFAIQNIKTYAIVCTTKTRGNAERIAAKLNK